MVLAGFCGCVAQCTYVQHTRIAWPSPPLSPLCECAMKRLSHEVAVTLPPVKACWLRPTPYLNRACLETPPSGSLTRCLPAAGPERVGPLEDIRITRAAERRWAPHQQLAPRRICCRPASRANAPRFRQGHRRVGCRQQAGQGVPASCRGAERVGRSVLHERGGWRFGTRRGAGSVH